MSEAPDDETAATLALLPHVLGRVNVRSAPAACTRIGVQAAASSSLEVK